MSRRKEIFPVRVLFKWKREKPKNEWIFPGQKIGGGSGYLSIGLQL